jgi:hypothetical protein
MEISNWVYRCLLGLMLCHMPLEQDKQSDRVLAFEALAVNLLERGLVNLRDLALLLGLDCVSVEKTSLRFLGVA